MGTIHSLFILFILQCVISSEDNEITQRKAGGQSYLSNNLPSLFIKAFTKVIHWKGHIPLEDINRPIDIKIYHGSGSATGGYMTADLSDMTLLDFTPWAYNPGKGVKISYTFRIPKIKINYDFKSDTPCSMTGTFKGQVYKSKMTIYMLAFKSNTPDLCEIPNHWDWTKVHLEPREYDYDLENVDYSWYNWVVVSTARTIIQGVLYSEMGDTDSPLVKDLQGLIQRALPSHVKEAFQMAVKEAKKEGVDICKEFLAIR